MKAWIARDEDGELFAYDADPDFDEVVFMETGGLWSLKIPDDLFPDLQPGYKQPVELTATPLGEAVKGDA